MFIRNLGSFRTTWVNNNKAPAALLNRLQTFRHIRHSHNAAVRRQRIAANNQHVIGVVDIWHRNQ